MKNLLLTTGFLASDLYDKCLANAGRLELKNDEFLRIFLKKCHKIKKLSKKPEINCEKKVLAVSSENFPVKAK